MPVSTLIKLVNGQLLTDFNWNSDPDPDSPIPEVIPPEPSLSQVQSLQIVAEDLRDGLHGIAEYPAAERMASYIDLLAQLGISIITVGIYPGSNSKLDSTIKILLSYLAKNHPRITPVILVLADPKSIRWANSCKTLNRRTRALIFMGTAPSRLLVEEWDRDYILENLAAAVKTASKTYKLDVIGATEHTTQTPPDFLRDIISTVVKNGARHFCIADTVGIARPVGTNRIIRFSRDVLTAVNAPNVALEWHGHNDLGNGQANAMTALGSGVRRIHCVARGIGERAGNTRLESVLLTAGEILHEHRKPVPWRMRRLHDVLSAYSDLTKMPEPQHGAMGKRAFATSLGIHSAAILKAEELYDEAKRRKMKQLAIRLKKMSQTIYSAVDARRVGRKQEIHVGPWSGKSTVRLALRYMSYTKWKPDDKTIDLVLTTAKQLGRELTDMELLKLINHES
ncbi:hypothetical protein A2Z33_06620 [Candidatus Gottesmanbacteria bacterium RBG_16_52_11]|uniref:2-isopropylmalate synthase n=1 Tax=Candidatus Gottesmanbacteria bacterium RBG_16_52_11 TaxID=1798374 RepID=A0A1F5YXL6_9BACT|nr:MAG: hypothetical protein A2Z33_06620 [Candidatus Gottesmanbacteria bacterium RBG_16_52_11]